MTDQVSTTNFNIRLRTSHWLAILWAAAFVSRLLLTSPFLSYPIALDDMYQYDMIARSLVQGNGYRWYAQADVETLRPYYDQFLDFDQLDLPPEGLVTTFRPPGYPFFLAGIYSMVPEESRFIFVRLVQCALTALMSPLVALLALRLRFNRGTAILSGLGMAIYPISMLYPIGLATENLFIPLVLLSVIAILWSAQSRSLWRAGLAGLLLGLAMLTRSVIAAFVILAIFWLARYAVTRWRAGLVMGLVAFGVCFPWSLRNSILHNRPAFVETALGYQLYIGYHPEGKGGFISKIAVQPLTILDDRERDLQTMQAALEFIRQDPLQIPIRALQRAVYFFSMEDRELIYFYSNHFFGEIIYPLPVLLYLLLILPWIGLGLLSPAGLLLSQHRPGVLLILALVAGYTLPHLLIIAEPRFHLTLVPVLLPFAAYTWAERHYIARRLLQSRFQTPAKLKLFILVILLLVLLWVFGFAQRWDTLTAVLSPGGSSLHLYY